MKIFSPTHFLRNVTTSTLREFTDAHPISQRLNIDWDSDPKQQDGRMPDPIDGAGTYWVWEFVTERNSVFLKNDDPVWLLNEDIHGVPVVNGLNNTVDLIPAVFQTKGDKQNIWISKIN